MSLTLFGDYLHPLRCSQLPYLMQCPWKVVMAFLELESREGGSAAQTGTAVHVAIQKFHLNGKQVREAVREMRALGDQYPMADLPDAERLFRAYAEDPRNSEAEVPYVEHQASIQLEEGIFLQGTIDQIREEEGTLKVWDVKTSKMGTAKILTQHYYQIAAYAVLASRTLRRDVQPGGLIMVRQYEKRGDNVFLGYPITLADAELMMHTVCDRVREIRLGRIAAVPNDLCEYCCGVPECMARLHRLTTKGN